MRNIYSARSLDVSDPSQVLTDVVAALSSGLTLQGITEVVAHAARALSGADGTTFVLRDGAQCYYVDENAISPLWKGKRFPITSCVSGWSMLHKEVVVIQDIYQDSRIPHDAYRPTFVKSLCMVPIRADNPMGAIGNYWKRDYRPTSQEIKFLQVLANSSAVALENLELKRAIQEQNNELETALNSLVHDLRSPVATILGFAELLEMHVKTDPKAPAARFVSGIQVTANRLNQQIDRMLGLYRIVRRDLEMQPVDVSSLGSEVMEHVRSQFSSREVVFSADPGLWAYADPFLARLILENLLSNAFKYSSKKDRCEIHLGKESESEREVVFYVRDNGDGFDPEQAHRLFRPLVRLHDDREFPGTGLGLASVARIVDLHGGTVRADGKKGQGATFYFSLPLQPG